MREEKRGPGLRGNILVEEGDAASTGTANAPADPSAAADQPAAEQPAAEQATEAGRADIGATVTGAEAKPEPESFAGTIREDAGTHATGPNPVVTDAVADPTGPNPVVRAELPAEPEGSEPPADPEGKAEAAAEPGAAPAEPEAAVAEPEAAPAEPGPAEAEAEAGQPGGVVEPGAHCVARPRQHPGPRGVPAARPGPGTVVGQGAGHHGQLVGQPAVRPGPFADRDRRRLRRHRASRPQLPLGWRALAAGGFRAAPGHPGPGRPAAVRRAGHRQPEPSRGRVGERLAGAAHWPRPPRPGTAPRAGSRSRSPRVTRLPATR